MAETLTPAQARALKTLRERGAVLYCYPGAWECCGASLEVWGVLQPGAARPRRDPLPAAEGRELVAAGRVVPCDGGLLGMGRDDIAFFRLAGREAAARGRGGASGRVKTGKRVKMGV